MEPRNNSVLRVDFTWMELANCRNVETATFYPEKHESALIQKMKTARQVCGECDVRKECLDYALEYEPLGFWGGMSEKDRKAYRRENRVHVRSRIFN
jgi:WhiB family redox-sensing transcriptional regulator